MTDRRPNANLAHACARCGRRYPRMYQEGDSIVCRVGECRPMRRSDSEAGSGWVGPLAGG